MVMVHMDMLMAIPSDTLLMDTATLMLLIIPMELMLLELITLSKLLHIKPLLSNIWSNLLKTRRTLINGLL